MAAARVRIMIGPSCILASMLGLAHVAALVVALIVALPSWAKLLVGVVIAASCGWSIYRSALLRGSRAIVELEIGESGRAVIRMRNGAWHDAQVQGSSLVSPWLTVLNMLPDGGRQAQHVVILPDNVDPEAIRSLRVLLRWSRPAGGASGKPARTPHERV